MASKQGSFCLTGSADDPDLPSPGGAEEGGEENETVGELNTTTRICSSQGWGERSK